MPPKTPKKKPKFFNPQNALRLKAGYGGLDPVLLERAEGFIQTNDVDFTDIAKGILDRLDKAVASVKRDNHRSKDAINHLVAPIMELKANGAMFKFSLLSDVADIVLDFLENIEYLNEDGFEIVDIHRQSMRIIISSQLRGSGGKHGDALIAELVEACRRYHKKHGV